MHDKAVSAAARAICQVDDDLGTCAKDCVHPFKPGDGPCPYLPNARAALRAFLASVEISDGAIEAAYGAAEFGDRWHIEDGDDFKRAVAAMSAKLADELSEGTGAQMR